MASIIQSPLVSVPLQGLPIAAALLDRNGAIATANSQFARLCGHTDSSDRPYRLTDIVADQDRQAVEEALSNLTALGDRVPRKCSIKALRARPPCLWLAIDVTGLGSESAYPYLACVQATPRRRRVDKPVAVRNIEPWPPLLMTLSHEFRGPLTAIRGWTQMAETGALSPEKMSRALDVIGRNAASLSHMIESLFDLSRRATGSLVLNRDMLDLTQLAQLVVESALPVAKRHDVSLNVKAGHAALLVDGDHLRLEQVVRNLVENAIKFTPTGGSVEVRTGCNGSSAELVVADNGRGISADVLPVIFEPFRHDDAMVVPAERGLGLGLALVRELVKLHGGEVRAFSGGKGQGSTFTVRLPLANSAVAA